ncbi:hypothetical protein HYPSUDRAFT_205140 [Hypholoma sublateritium FD-334 SS-4]|uniref:Uncharacterized protein n=1 Tax=Hypholoma sublateritium (strain FD-334 SS-4) TaxID=945553 RepID=A0A0D2KVV0_HYPSF|nr:hypothetical protein HYPSUDRAFT_205140 [Hypholoma sublateritium FD-334 SS-4]
MQGILPDKIYPRAAHDGESTLKRTRRRATARSETRKNMTLLIHPARNLRCAYHAAAFSRTLHARFCFDEPYTAICDDPWRACQLMITDDPIAHLGICNPGAITASARVDGQALLRAWARRALHLFEDHERSAQARRAHGTSEAGSDSSARSTPAARSLRPLNAIFSSFLLGPPELSRIACASQR